MTDGDWPARAKAMTDDLDASGRLGQEWRASFTATPRHVFVPRFYASDECNQPRTLIDSADPAQRDRWLEAAYSNSSLVTRYEVVGTMADGTEVRAATSSASAPGIVAVMLDRLDVQEGNRVLEIGTGTGYNAALLCHRLGAGNVTSVDIDPDLVERARDRLASVGYRPEIAAGDGYRGWARGAPYDRIIATAAVGHIPPEWVRQLAPGGRIVTPLHGPHDGPLVVLTKTSGDDVTGWIDAERAYFMPLCPNSDDQPTPDVASPVGMAHEGRTSLDPRRLVAPHPDLAWFVHLHVGRLTSLGIGTTHTPDGPRDHLVVGTPTAYVETDLNPTDDGGWPVRQHGQRIWDTIEHAVASYDRHDHPNRTRFGIGALDNPSRQYVWLDDPDGPYSWPLNL